MQLREGGRAMLSALLAAVMLLVSTAVHADTDVFMQAVGFALTGRDDAQPIPIDRANCVFAIGKYEVYRLNNVYTDKITIHTWEEEPQWLEVELHGDPVVLELTTVPMRMMVQQL
jgi:hypothetical protein